MADINGAAAGNLGGLSGDVDNAQLRWWDAILVSPANLNRPTSLLPTLTIKITDSWDDATAQAQVQVDDNADFSSVTWSTTDTSVPFNTDNTVTVGTTLTNGGTYYWRARGGDGTSWGDWTPAREFSPLLDVGNAIEYVLENVGYDVTAFTPNQDALEYVLENVGYDVTAFTPNQDALEYVLENVGFQQADFAASRDALEYVLVGDVNTAVPTPHIWFLQPTTGRPNDGFDIYGFGFGDLQATYSGNAQGFFDGTWQGLNVVAWQTFPANSASTTVNRVIGRETDITQGSRPETLPLTDTFDGASPDPRWTPTAGTWTTSGGLLVPPATDAKLLVQCMPEGRIDVYPTVAALGNGGIIFRYTDETHYWVFWFYHYQMGYYNGGGYNGEVYYGSSNWTAGAKYSVAWTPTTITAYKNDVVLYTVTGATGLVLADPGAAKQMKCGVHGFGTTRMDTASYVPPLMDRYNLDQQHQRISVTVPVDADPPFMPVKVVTNG
jgi:hypothetical protein